MSELPNFMGIEGDQSVESRRTPHPAAVAEGGGETVEYLLFAGEYEIPAAITAVLDAYCEPSQRAGLRRYISELLTEIQRLHQQDAETLSRVRAVERFYFDRGEYEIAGRVREALATHPAPAAPGGDTARLREALKDIADITEPLALLLVIDKQVTPKQLLPVIQGINRTISAVIPRGPRAARAQEGR